jgi:excisionase family DNA binding protein
MEKICIVKRRREYTQPDVKVTITQPEISEKSTPEAVVSNVMPEPKTDLSDRKIPDVHITSSHTEKNKIFVSEVMSNNITTDTPSDAVGKKNVEEFADRSSSTISITMTKEQSELLKQSEYIKELLNGIKNDPALDIKMTPDGRLSLNYRFKDSLMMRMLSPNQVCQMLQVSRSFLQKIIHENHIKSYKVGRMRRFLLEDILDYLSSDTDLSQFNNNQ